MFVGGFDWVAPDDGPGLLRCVAVGSASKAAEIEYDVGSSEHRVVSSGETMRWKTSLMMNE